jgi:hypothetical protein
MWLVHDFSRLSKDRTNWIFAHSFCNKQKQMITSQTWLLLVLRSETAGTMSKQSINLHNGSHNRTKHRKKRDRKIKHRRTSSVFSETVEVWWIMSSFREVNEWIRDYIRLLQVVYEKQCERNDRSLAGTHLVSLIQQSLRAHGAVYREASHKTPVVWQLHYSPELYPSYFFCFRNWKLF